MSAPVRYRLCRRCAKSDRITVLESPRAVTRVTVGADAITPDTPGDTWRITWCARCDLMLGACLVRVEKTTAGCRAAQEIGAIRPLRTVSRLNEEVKP